MPIYPEGRPGILVVREFEELIGLSEDERRDLKRFTLAWRTDSQLRSRRILALRNDRLYAQNYVGVIETRQGTVVEILPKIDLSGQDFGGIDKYAGEQTDRSTDSFACRQHERTRRIFLTMLRDWRGLGTAQFDTTGIRATSHVNMLEAFVHLFLTSVVLLTQRGLARAYRRREANLPVCADESYSHHTSARIWWIGPVSMLATTSSPRTGPQTA